MGSSQGKVIEDLSGEIADRWAELGSSQGKVIAVPDGARPVDALGAVEDLSGEIADRWAELGRSGMMPDGLGLPELACDVATLANMVVALSAQLRAALQLPPA